MFSNFSCLFREVYLCFSRISTEKTPASGSLSRRIRSVFIPRISPYLIWTPLEENDEQLPVPVSEPLTVVAFPMHPFLRSINLPTSAYQNINHCHRHPPLHHHSHTVSVLDSSPFCRHYSYSHGEDYFEHRNGSVARAPYTPEYDRRKKKRKLEETKQFESGSFICFDVLHASYWILLVVLLPREFHRLRHRYHSPISNPWSTAESGGNPAVCTTTQHTTQEMVRRHSHTRGKRSLRGMGTSSTDRLPERRCA